MAVLAGTGTADDHDPDAIRAHWCAQLNTSVLPTGTLRRENFGGLGAVTKLEGCRPAPHPNPNSVPNLWSHLTPVLTIRLSLPPTLIWRLRRRCMVGAGRGGKRPCHWTYEHTPCPRGRACRVPCRRHVRRPGGQDGAAYCRGMWACDGMWLWCGFVVY